LNTKNRQHPALGLKAAKERLPGLFSNPLELRDPGRRSRTRRSKREKCRQAQLSSNCKALPARDPEAAALTRAKGLTAGPAAPLINLKR